MTAPPFAHGPGRGLFLSVLAIVGLASSWAGAAERAATCESFVSMFGISNARPDQASYLVDLGLRNYRTSLQIVADAAINTEYDAHGLSGCFLGLGTQEPSVPETIARLKGIERGAIYCFEGPNEINNTGIGGFTYGGAAVTDTNVDPAVNYMNDIAVAMRADPATADIPIACFTQINTGVKVGGRFPFDLENAHPYPGYGPATFGYGPARDLAGTTYGSLAWNIRSTDALETGSATRKPIVATETGYSVDKMTPLAQSKYVPKLFADYFAHGRHPRVYLFTLANEVNYGLLDDSMNKRPAYYAVKSLINTLADATWDSTTKTWKTVAFAPASLDYTLDGAPASIDHVLLQRHTGEFYLLLWNEIPVHAANNAQAFGADVVNAPVHVTLRVPDPSVTDVTVFVQGDGGDYSSSHPPLAGRTIALTVPDSFVIIKLSGPPSFQPPYAGDGGGAGGDGGDDDGAAPANGGGGAASAVDGSSGMPDVANGVDAEAGQPGGDAAAPARSRDGAGCGCRTTSGSSSGGLAAVAMTLLALRRRRHQRPEDGA